MDNKPQITVNETFLDALISKHEMLFKPLSSAFLELKGEDLNFRLALAKAQKAAQSDLPIVIGGESGTGKEILARAIHESSPRSKGPFVDINCAAIPESLIESELFGYERGAFTGALREGKTGLFEEAHEGTIFLDEIGDASAQVQTKILRVLESGEFRRVGGANKKKVNVRVISATNKSLEDMVSQGRFRDDLYYRLNTIYIILPPLRDRGDDIRSLSNYFLKQGAGSEGGSIFFSGETLRILEAYSWPGNIRELKAVVDYALLMREGNEITPRYLPPFLPLTKPMLQGQEVISLMKASTQKKTRFLSTFIKEVERNLIGLAIRNSRNKSEAIKILGISRRTFYSKLRELG